MCFVWKLVFPNVWNFLIYWDKILFRKSTRTSIYHFDWFRLNLCSVMVHSFLNKTDRVGASSEPLVCIVMVEQGSNLVQWYTTIWWTLSSTTIVRDYHKIGLHGTCTTSSSSFSRTSHSMYIILQLIALSNSVDLLENKWHFLTKNFHNILVL